jgi:hypothetical protein
VPVSPEEILDGSAAPASGSASTAYGDPSLASTRRDSLSTMSWAEIALPS